MAIAIAKALAAVIALWACGRGVTYLAPGFRLSPALLQGRLGAASPAPKVLYILECEGPQEWQAVPTQEAVVNWVRELKDRLTVHKGNPEGEDLTIPSWWVHKDVQPLLEPLKGTAFIDDRGGISLYNVVEVQMQAAASSVWLPKYLLVLYQMTMVPGGPPPEDLYVAASKSFWQTVEATAAEGRFIFKANMTAPEQRVSSIKGYTIVLPTILSVMYGQGEWPEDSVSTAYGDHSAWDRVEILEMLSKFLDATHAITLPDLEEYQWRSDKIALYDLLQKYYEQDPAARFAPIPTAAINLPVNATFHRNTCFTQRYEQPAVIPPEAIRATAVAILSAAAKLEGNADAAAIQQNNPVIANTAVRKFVLKRNHSGFARKVVQVSLDLSNWHHDSLLLGLLDTTPGSAPVASDTQDTQTVRNTQDFDATVTDGAKETSDRELDDQQGLFSTASDSGPSALLDAAAAMPAAPVDAADQKSTKVVDIVSGGRARVKEPLHDAQLLLAAAERMLRESCGEDWLLQPFIPDMGSNEYRVNLVGGAKAQGLANDTAAVFTPAKAADNQLYLYNMTLPKGFFSRAPLGTTDLFDSLGELHVVDQYNSTGVEEFSEFSYFPYPVWREPAMHQLLVDVALGGAQAFIQSERPGRMSQNVLLRIDLALTQHGGQVQAFINEAHYFADATLMFPVWPPETNHNSSTAMDQPTNGRKRREDTSWGLCLAEQLWREVVCRNNQL